MAEGVGLRILPWKSTSVLTSLSVKWTLYGQFQGIARHEVGMSGSLYSEKLPPNSTKCGLVLLRTLMNSLKFDSLASYATLVSLPRNSSWRSQTR